MRQVWPPAVPDLPTPVTLVDLGVTATAAELNILDGATVTTAELNVLDGIPPGLTAVELGYMDGVTSAVQPQLNTKFAASNWGALIDASTYNNVSALSFNDLTTTGLFYGNNMTDGPIVSTAYWYIKVIRLSATSIYQEARMHTSATTGANPQLYTRTMVSGAWNDWVLTVTPASSSRQGTVELLTNAEAQAGADTERAMTARAHIAVHAFGSRQRTASQNLTNNTNTTIALNTATVAADGIANATNGLSVAVDGLYLVSFGVEFAYNANGRRLVYAQVNGATPVPTARAVGNPDAGGSTFLTASKPLVLAAGDVVTLLAQQTSGGTLAVASADLTLARLR